LLVYYVLRHLLGLQTLRTYYVSLEYAIDLQRLITEAGDYVPVGYWSTVEVHVSVICACLPTLPFLFRRIIPATRQNSLAVSLEPVIQTARKPSDILPLLKVVRVHEHRVNR
jgi:hypothetical protein